MREALALGILTSREQVMITSKLAPASHGYDAATQAIHRSCEALALAYIDLLLVHWPAKAVRWQRAGAGPPRALSRRSDLAGPGVGGVQKLAPEDPHHAMLREETWR